MMISLLWYPITIFLTVLGAGWLYSMLGGIIAADSTFQSVQAEYFKAWILEQENSFLETSFGNKLLICGIMTVLVLILPICCKLDEYLRELPGGDFFEMRVGESPFEDLWFLRLIPGMIFLAYLALRIAVTLFYSDAVFDIQHFSLRGEHYNVFQWITQVSYFLIIAFLIFLIFDSFVSAGFIGGILHLIAVMTANLLSFVLVFVILITFLASIPAALFMGTLALVIWIIFFSFFKVVIVYV